MKKIIIPCMFVISILTATAAQLQTENLNSKTDTLITDVTKSPSVLFMETVEEEDVAFDFDTNKYLPIGFDPYITFEEKYGIEFEVVLEEKDETFDFNTNAYLPVGFNLKKSILNGIEDINIEDEEDEAFDFDIKMYLPTEFDAFETKIASDEL